MFEMYSIVRLKSVDLSQISVNDTMSARKPMAGDEATILMIYESPLAYEVECLGLNGTTAWVATVPHHLIENID